MSRRGHRRRAHWSLAALIVVVAASPAFAEQVDAEADLGIVKSVSADAADPGDLLVYTLRASNAGPFAAVAVHAVDTLPAGVSFVSAPGCIHDAGVVDCLAGVSGIMFPGDETTFEITVEVDADATGDLRNMAIIENREDPDTGPVDPNPANDSDDAVTTVGTTPATGSIGDFVWNDLDEDGLQDPGEAGIPGVVVVVAGPSGTFNAATDADGMYLVTDLAPGSYMATVDLGTVPAGFSPTTSSALTVELGDGESFLDADFGYSAGGSHEVLIDLELDKSVAPAVANVGDTITFTLTLANRGPDRATGIEVEDILPAGLEFVSATGDGLYDDTTGAWVVGTVDFSSSATLTLTTIAREPGSFTNSAEVVQAVEEDSDSTPGDGMGDDFDTAIVAVVEVGASAQIGDTVWLDVDADGRQDPGEAGIPGVTVRLTGPGGTDVRVTDTGGKYLFAGLDAGIYTVSVDTSTVADDLGLTTVGSFTTTVADDGVFLDADFGFAEILPATGVELVWPALAGLLLLAGGAAAVLAARRR